MLEMGSCIHLNWFYGILNTLLDTLLDTLGNRYLGESIYFVAYFPAMDERFAKNIVWNDSRTT
jgi:hypothetical protein